MAKSIKSTSSNSKSYHCPSCKVDFSLGKGSKFRKPKFCANCGAFLQEITQGITETLPTQDNTQPIPSSINLVEGHYDESQNVQFSIGNYKILRSIGKGGMGEVFLAYDTVCGRRIALKRIREDLLEHIQMHKRFLKEAHITSQLTHPSIIPIYSIHNDKSSVYYSMPFVEGETLKQLIRRARNMEKKGEKADSIGASIPALVRVFLNICQAIAYSHAKGVLHRDLKPENIILGSFGEVLILDWGLAKMIRSQEDEFENGEEEEIHTTEKHPLHSITRLGKVVGTVTYMAPERALGNPATYQTDIYSLGVILYQILTLHLPFHRGSLKQFRENMHKEALRDPAEMAPYRDVPKLLARITAKCMAIDPEQRYKRVTDLIHDLESYIEGRSEWFQIAELRINNKEDWEFQENVLIAEHVAITRGADISDWVSLMISKVSFNENIKLQARLYIGEKGNGLGFLLSIPEAAERVQLNDGYCLWLSSEKSKTTKLLRSTVEVLSAPDIVLQRHTWYDVRIEKIDHKIYFYLNDVLQFTYISHMPLAGTHVGLLARDDDFELKDFFVFVGGQNVMVNCLAVPDTFLAHKDYATALTEYRRIGYSFPGRAEGREAMFRAGITLLEQAKDQQDAAMASHYFDLALQEFEKLHMTPGAPLEYLGKALVYEAMNDFEEEIKCFELAFRRYPNHLLLPVLQEQIVYRMHETSRYHRKAAYHFMLMTVRHIPKLAHNSNSQKLFHSLERHWEILPFIEKEPDATQEEKDMQFAIQLAFWLARPYVLSEIIDEAVKYKRSETIIENALFALIELGSWELAEKKLQGLAKHDNHILEIIFLAHRLSTELAVEQLSRMNFPFLSIREQRVILYIMQKAIREGETSLVEELYFVIKDMELQPLFSLRVDCQRVEAFLRSKNWERASELFHKYPYEFYTQENIPLYYLYGCWLHATEGLEMALIHFSGVLDVSFPRTSSLLAHYLNNKIGEKFFWYQKAFVWEKRMLYHELALFKFCGSDLVGYKKYVNLEEKEYVNAAE